MTATVVASGKRKTSTPPDGYVCNLCSVSGHWIQQCPQKSSVKKQRTSSHKPVAGVDPSQKDIDAARDMQKIPPPMCFCKVKSRLRKVKRSHAGGEQSRAIGKYFFFCAKSKDDPTKCKFARAVEDELTPNSQRLCTFFSKNGSCKKGDACKFRHEAPKKRSEAKTEAAAPAVRLCTFFAKNGSCKKGDECQFRHECAKASDNFKESTSSSPTSGEQGNNQDEYKKGESDEDDDISSSDSRVSNNESGDDDKKVNGKKDDEDESSDSDSSGSDD